MAISSESTIIIDVEIKASEARKESDALGVSIAKLTAINKDLAKEGKKNTTTYVENRQQITALSREQRAYIAIANGAAGSNNQLRAQLSLLTSQYNALSKEERENTIAGRALAIQTRSISDELKENEQKVGDNRRSVGEYTESINRSVVGQIPFINNLSIITDAFGAMSGVINEAKAAQEANTIATELNTSATAASQAAEIAMTTAIEAKTVAERQAIVANELRAEADRQRTIIELQLVAAEEREAAVLAQLGIEEQAIVAEERLRIAAEEALVASQAELVAVEEARIATEAGLAASTAALSAAERSAAASATFLKTALASTGIGAILLLVGSLVTYLGNLDSVTDGTSVVMGNLKAQVNELGRSLINLDFKGVTERMQAAGIQAAVLTDQAQSLEDSLLNQSVKSQKAQAEIAKLRVEAMNRTLSPEVRQRYLAQAEQIDADDLAAKKKLADRELQQAQLSIAITGNLTKYQREQLQQRGVEYALYLQNNLTKQGKVTDEQTKALAKAFTDQTQIQQEYTQRSEKRQNLADKIAEQAEQKREQLAEKEKAAQEKLAAELDKINQDRIKSQLETAQRLLTGRQVEQQNINADIDKRVEVYRKYGQDTSQLELERQSRLTVLNEKFSQQDLKTIRTNLNEAAQLRISLIADSSERAFAQQQLANENAIAETDRGILALAARIALGEQGLTELIQSEAEKRKALVAVGDQQRVDNAELYQERIRQIEQAGSDAAYQYQLEQLQRDYDLNQQRLQTNEQLTQSYSDLVGAIGGLTDKQTVLGKIAFIAQKAFAIQQIILNAELTKSQIILRYEILKTQATLAAGFAGPFAPAVAAAAIAGLSAAEGVELAKATASEVLQVAIVGATAIAGVTGKAKGGIQDYKSNGKGGVLPGYAKKDDTNAYLRSGEAVVVSEAARDPQTRRLLSDINVAYGGNPYPGLALGGLYGGSGLQRTNNDITNQVFQSNQLAQTIDRLKVFVAVTDINSAQAKQAKVEDAGNF